MNSETDILEHAPPDAAACPGELERVGRYDVESVLGRGGMGIVYRGVLRGDGGFRRAVAIKRLKPELASDARYVAMLIDEAKISARVRSPHVVEVLDVVHVGAEFFIVMPLVEGASLDQVIGRLQATHAGPLAPDVAVGIVMQVLRGLAAAHEARDETGGHLGIVHRDVSPSNIHLGADGLVRLIDFGIAKAADRMQQKTETGERKGKPSYMAPEQLMTGDVDGRSDVFSAGVVLAELLMSARLYPNEALLGAMSRGEPLPKTLLAATESGIDRVGGCRGVLERMLAVSPNARPRTAAAALALLDEVAPGAVVAAQTWAADAVSLGIASNRAHPPAVDTVAAMTVSGAAVVPTPARPLAAHRRWRAPVVGVVVGLLAMLSAFAFAQSRPDRSASSFPVTASAVDPPIVPPPSVEAPAADVHPSEPAASAPSGVAKRTLVRPAPVLKRPVAAVSSAAKPGCGVPFDIAPDGTKIPKRACF